MASIVAAVAALGFVLSLSSPASAQSYNQYTEPTFYVASSTAFTITTGSQRILSTSTPTHRVATVIQPINCTASGALFVNMNRDAAASANTGLAVLASTTFQLTGYSNVPVVQGAAQAIESVGTCTVLVTEWRLIQ